MELGFTGTDVGFAEFFSASIEPVFNGSHIRTPINQLLDRLWKVDLEFGSRDTRKVCIAKTMFPRDIYFLRFLSDRLHSGRLW